MNGWQRLFCVVSVVLLLPGVALWVVTKPVRSGPEYASNCEDLGRGYSFTPEQARKALNDFPTGVSDSLRDGPWAQDPIVDGSPSLPIMWTDCAAQLSDIASGAKADKAMADWLKSAGYGLLGYAVLLGLLYAGGWSMGWIARGFRKS